MPIREYQCEKCGKTAEKLEKMDDRKESIECGDCGGKAIKIYSRTGRPKVIGGTPIHY